MINLFVPNAPFLYPPNPLKTLENLTVFLCFQRVEKWCTGNKWVNYFEAWFDQRKGDTSYSQPLLVSFILTIVKFNKPREERIETTTIALPSDNNYAETPLLLHDALLNKELHYSHCGSSR